MSGRGLPGPYPPVKLTGPTLVDGGVSADTPVLQAEQHGASICYVLPCAKQSPAQDGPRGAARFYALTRIVKLNSRHDLAAARSTLHVLPIPETSAANIVDFRDTDRLIAQSYQPAREQLSRSGQTRPTRA